MHSNDISGNLWNPLDWGEYLIWKTPGSRVSVDGRFRTAYPEEVIQDHFDFASGQPGWQALLEKYPTELVLARKRDGTHLRMNQLPGWVKIYEDLICVLYVKNDPRLALWGAHEERALHSRRIIARLSFSIKPNRTARQYN